MTAVSNVMTTCELSRTSAVNAGSDGEATTGLVETAAEAPARLGDAPGTYWTMGYGVRERLACVSVSTGLAPAVVTATELMARESVSDAGAALPGLLGSYSLHSEAAGVSDVVSALPSSCSAPEKVSVVVVLDVEAAVYVIAACASASPPWATSAIANPTATARIAVAALIGRLVGK